MTEQVGRLVIAELAEGLRRSCSNDICHWDWSSGVAGNGLGILSGRILFDELEHNGTVSNVLALQRGICKSMSQS